ncbi:MAG: hypothetical protein IPK07_32790 [Deltaproteobacteria bacterium]|nr:hypothetical protein [Deltaproteobacteria bacterium]
MARVGKRGCGWRFGSTSAVALAAILGAGCGDGAELPALAEASDAVYALAGGCHALAAAGGGGAAGRFLAATGDGAGFAFDALGVSGAATLITEPADLGVYLLRDADRRYLFGAEGGELARVEHLESDLSRNEDGFVSPALWKVEELGRPAGSASPRFVLTNVATGRYLGVSGLVEDRGRALPVAFVETSGCTPFEDLTLDAEGSVTKTRFDDGDLFGLVDAHEHLFTHLGFGAGGVFHGAPFHPLGVEHALPSCEPFHGRDGRGDLVSYVFDGHDVDWAKFARIVLTGDLGSFNHHTEGYPEFTDWPRSWRTSTHQVMYYRWLERAYLAGMRLMVQHATTNEVLCEMTQKVQTQTPRISCNEMVSVDREIDATYALERYIDAHAGGPGKGWFRVVTSPAEARRVIGDGKLAVILGIETTNLFDCFLDPRPGYPLCDDAMVREKLDRYYALGVRGLFPVHKADNGFSPGDGSRGILELANIANTGRFTNYTDVECPDVGSVFDWGGLTFGGLNRPRAVYDAPPVFPYGAVFEEPFKTFLPYLGGLLAGPAQGNYCQNATLQPLGETLLVEMMKRGMLIEVDHLPRRSYQRAYELLHRYDYPAVGSHGSDNRGDLYTLGGVSTTGLPRCQDPNRPDRTGEFRARIESIAEHGLYPAQGFGFDFNGFAGGPRPRFGSDSDCPPGQADPVTYPFRSYAGDVELDPPRLGNRAIDFATEGMIHIGLLPELIQDSRSVGFTDRDLEPLFRSAEGYIRMWERAEARAAALR